MWENAYQNPLGFDGELQPNLDPQQEAFESAARARYDYCLKVAKTFKGPAGREVLKQWREATIESAAWLPSLATEKSMEAAQAHAFAREGQNAFVRDIELCIEIANNHKTFEDFCDAINQVNIGKLP